MDSEVEYLKERYTKGTRVELMASMIEEQGMPRGLKGTVLCVDDIGSIHVDWDNGRTLALIPGEDSFRKIPEPLQEEEIKMNM